MFNFSFLFLQQHDTVDLWSADNYYSTCKAFLTQLQSSKLLVFLSPICKRDSSCIHAECWATESLRLEKTSKITKSNRQPIPTNHIPQCHIYMFLEHLPGWWHHHLTGQSIPMPHHSFWQEVLPNIQPELPLAQLKTITPHPSKLQPPCSLELWQERSDNGLS